MIPNNPQDVLNLKAGLVTPAAPPPPQPPGPPALPPQPSTGGGPVSSPAAPQASVDLSAGLVPSPAATSAAPAAPAAPFTLTVPKHFSLANDAAAPSNDPFASLDLQKSPHWYENVPKGVVKGLTHTVGGAASLIDRMRMAEQGTTPATDATHGAVESAEDSPSLQPQGLGQDLGYFGEQAAEYAVPGVVEGGELPSTVARFLPDSALGRLAARSVAEGANVGAVSGLQGGGHLKPAAYGAILGAGLPIAAAGAGYPARAAGRYLEGRLPGKILQTSLQMPESLFRKGINPTQAIADEGIVAGSKESLLPKIQAAADRHMADRTAAIEAAPDKQHDIAGHIRRAFNSAASSALDQGRPEVADQLQQRAANLAARHGSDTSTGSALNARTAMREGVNYGRMNNPTAQIHPLEQEALDDAANRLAGDIHTQIPGTAAPDKRYGPLADAVTGTRRAIDHKAASGIVGPETPSLTKVQKLGQAAFPTPVATTAAQASRLAGKGLRKFGSGLVDHATGPLEPPVEPTPATPGSLNQPGVMGEVESRLRANPDGRRPPVKPLRTITARDKATGRMQRVDISAATGGEDKFNAARAAAAERRASGYYPKRPAMVQDAIRDAEPGTPLPPAADIRDTIASAKPGMLPSEVGLEEAPDVKKSKSKPEPAPSNPNRRNFLKRFGQGAAALGGAAAMGLPKLIEGAGDAGKAAATHDPNVVRALFDAHGWTPVDISDVRSAHMGGAANPDIILHPSTNEIFEKNGEIASFDPSTGKWNTADNEGTGYESLHEQLSSMNNAIESANASSAEADNAVSKLRMVPDEDMDWDDATSPSTAQVKALKSAGFKPHHDVVDGYDRSTWDLNRHGVDHYISFDANGNIEYHVHGYPSGDRTDYIHKSQFNKLLDIVKRTNPE